MKRWRFFVKWKALQILFLGLLSGQTMAVNDDMSDWISTNIDFSGRVLSFKNPGGFSKEFPDKKIIDKVDVTDPAIYKSGRLIVFDKYWDYKGFFWQGVFGTLSMTVLVFKKPDDFPDSLLDLNNLQTLIDSLLKSEYGATNQRLREKGQHQYIVKLPDQYNKAGPGKDWLNYHLGGQADSDVYIKPLDESHYLEIVFNFVDNSRNYKTDWRRDAQELTEKIMQTMTWQASGKAHESSIKE